MTKIFGHRGCRGPNNPPENSLAAFRAAIAQGADGIEFDLFLTIDKTLVVFHDVTLEKRTNGKDKTARKTLSQLKKLRLKENDGKRLSNETIPTFDQVMTLVKKQADENFILNIEIKQKKIAREVASALKGYIKQGWKAERFLVASFDIPNLRIIRKELPTIPIAALFAGRGPTWNISKLTLAKKLRKTAALKPATVNITLHSMTPNAIALIRKTGAAPVAWTSKERPPSRLSLKKRRALTRFLTEGYALITDYPAEVRALTTNK